jgi:rhodanese-related sulfurtransferase
MNAHGLVVSRDGRGVAPGGRGLWSLPLILLLMLVSAPAAAWDEAQAANYNRFFARFDEQATARELRTLPVEKIVEALNQGESLTFLDVRTRREQSVIGLAWPGTLNIPMNEVFRPENLARIPTDHRVVVTCQSGGRCLVVALALRSIGFEKVFSMKGGLAELMRYLDPKTAFPAPATPSQAGH